MTPIEPGMLVECVRDDWSTAYLPDRSVLPKLGSRWFVISVVMASFYGYGVFDFLVLRGRENCRFWAGFFKPVDGEFERLKKAVEEQTDEVEFLRVQRKHVPAA